VDESDALLELRLLVLLRGRERALEVVEDGQELVHEPLGGARDQVGLLARRALAVVVELRLEAPKSVQILVPLARDLRELVDLHLGVSSALSQGLSLGQSRIDARVSDLRLFGHDRFAPSSSSITS
jgi:hypothetical protein